MSLITCSSASFAYDGKTVLEDVSFSVDAGNYLCVVGENGSGKSTLMKTILALTPPIAGAVRMADGLLPRQIGYLPQQTQVQRDFPASVREIVMSGFQGRCGLRPYYTKQEKAEAESAMDALGINTLSHCCYRELSGGQQQRVLLARALCAAGKCLLLDEPVSGLDPKVTADLYERIEALHQSGITILMISHDLEAAMRYADHILHIGENVFYGTRKAYAESGPGRSFLIGREDCNA